MSDQTTNPARPMHEDDGMPKGIEFFNIKSGDTHFARLEPTIQAYINSSDMGINASRGQDFGWRLGPTWVKAVKAFRRNETKMELLVAKNGGQKPSTTQILYAIYGEQLRAAQEAADENDAPFEESYLQEISGRSEPTTVRQRDEDGPIDNFDQVVGDVPVPPANDPTDDDLKNMNLDDPQNHTNQ